MDPNSGSGADSGNKSGLKNRELMVGAPRFELGTSCAQARRVIFLSPSFASSFLKTKDLSRDLVVGRSTKMCLRVRRVPRIFPIVSGNHEASAAKRPAKSRAVMIRADL